MLKLFVSVCVMLTAAFQVSPSKPDAQSSRQLYEQAAKAIASADPRAAITPLEQLIQEQPTSSLACIAVVHLAECYVSIERDQQAASLLEEWSARIAAASKSTKLDANLDAHHFRVWLQAAKRIKDDHKSIQSLETLVQTLETRPAIDASLIDLRTDSQVELARRLAAAGQLEMAAKQLAKLSETQTESSSESQLLIAIIYQQLGSHEEAKRILESLLESEPSTPAHLLARIELATYALQDHQLEVASKCLSPIIASVEPSHGLDPSLDLRFRILWSELELAKGHATRGLEVLPSDSELEKLDEPRQIALRFSRAEAAAQAGKNEIAMQDLRWLSDFAERATDKPDWAVTVALRQGELLLKTKDYANLNAVVEKAKDQFTEFDRLHEFDYLLARAAMLQIDFDQARLHLQTITESEAAKKSSAAARAQWMLGETYFMEQKLNEAVNAYRPVTLVPESQPWQSLACMQSAKCYELLGQSKEALDAYQQVVTNTKDEKLRQEAHTRIEVLERIAKRTKTPVLSR